MLELVNLSNCQADVELINNDAACLQTFLEKHNLNGLEMMFCNPWNSEVHKKKWIYGVHLKFWPCWLDFWRSREQELLLQFGSMENVNTYYGSLTKTEWLNIYRENIRAAKLAGARYIVFHVSHARTRELFDWQFSASDQEVIEATIEVVNELADEIPANMALLFENLWWPGLTLRNKELTAMLLTKVKHPNVGIMMDTGHLMNTNLQLQTEIMGIDYVLETIEQLGPYRNYIRGIHLHKSLAGRYLNDYFNNKKATTGHSFSDGDVMSHILKMDEHRPFTNPYVQHIVDYVKPDFLVHEFLLTSLNDWAKKVALQRQAIHGVTHKPD